MTKVITQTLKGFRDFLPIDAIARENAVKKIKDVFKLYGYDPLETPALEYADTLLGKYGDEADKMLYTFTDRGGRKIGLRYDQTVPASRVVAQYPDIPKPFKRYQIQNVWRAENTQRGRYREFLQCDADIFGIDSYTADSEILALFGKCYEVLGIDYKIYVNSRQILKNILDGIIPDNLILSVIRTIDKLDNKPENEVRDELLSKGFSEKQVEEIFIKLNSVQLSEDKRLETTIQLACQQFGLKKEKIEFKPTLARGLDYYTGIIFEAKATRSDIGSIGGGGRYDELIGTFSGNKVPAVGFALGFDRIMDILILSNNPKTNAKVFIATIDTNEDKDGISLFAFSIATKLRSSGICTEINLVPNSKIDKQLKYADKKGTPYVVIIGPEEKESGQLTLKDFKNKQEEKLSLDQLIYKLKTI